VTEKAIKQYLEYLKLSGIQDIFYSQPIIKQENPEPAAQQKPAETIFTNSDIDASEQLKQLEENYKNCQNCALWKGRNKFCYGNGNPRAELMLIGEGPGADENASGQVFVGRAGQLLTKMLAAINLPRDEVYITNIVKCRPPGNRNPLPEERRSCLPYLLEQIEIIQPKLLLLLGKVAAETLLGITGTMATFRSHTHLFQGIKTYVSYHPSALLRNQGWKKYAWIDLQNLQKDYDSISN